jgi:hypothetical protein
LGGKLTTNVKKTTKMDVIEEGKENPYHHVADTCKNKIK